MKARFEKDFGKSIIAFTFKENFYGMKKYLFAIVALVLGFQAEAQKIGMWFDVGLKGAYGPTLLANTNIFNDRTYDHKITTGYGIGGKVGIYFNEFNGITIDAMYSRSKQGFSYETMNQATAEFNHDVEWTSLDLYLLYRMQQHGIYFEIGPAYSMVSDITQNDQGSPDVTDLKDFYNDNFISGVVGFGGYVANSERFTLMLGMRAAYAVTDFVNEAGKAANYPNPNRTMEYDSYKATHPLSVQLVVEANFGIGYFAKTCCSNRATFFSK